MEENGLVFLPHSILQLILSRMDVPSICAAASSCQLLHLCAYQVFPHMPSFHLLEISPTPEILKRLLSVNSAVTSLKLDCSHLDDTAIEFVARSQLQELYLQNCGGFSSKLLKEIGRCCTTLRSLSLDLDWFGDNAEIANYSTALEQLLQGCSLLESLSLRSETPCFDPQAYELIPFHLRALKMIDLGFVPQRVVKNLFDSSLSQRPLSVDERNVNCRNLETLRLFLDRITDSFMMIICGNLPLLIELELKDEPSEEPMAAFDLTNWGMQQIGACSNLRRLALSRSQYMYPTFFRRVSDLGIMLMADKCRNLESIKLRAFSRITDAGCRAILHNCMNLHTFELCQTSQLTDLAFHDIRATPLMLVSINLAFCSLISDCSLRQLAHCKALETLNCNGCRSIGDLGVKAISGLWTLKSLGLNYSDISDEALLALGQGCASLVSLSIRGCKRITDAGITFLVDGGIRWTLQEMDFSCIPNLTDAATLALVQSRMQIVQLRLRSCSLIGDMTVMALASMSFEGRGLGGTLRFLDIWNCQGLSALSAKWFRKPYFPRLQWLGLSKSHLRLGEWVAISKQRPFLKVRLDGGEFDHCHAEEINVTPDSCCWEEDELEQWLQSEEEDNA